MRKTLILATGAMITAVVAVWGATVITANPNATTAAPASASVSVMQMMINARNLPEEQFDAI